MVSASEFASYMGADASNADLVSALAVGAALVDAQLSHAFRGIPDEVYDFLVKEVASNIYRRSQSTDGQYESEAPRPANDPLQSVRAVIRKYVMTL